MPSLFGSRRRNSSARPPVDRTTATNATLAASAAMLHRPPSRSSLSSAAAAAALRSATTTPEPVGSIQTKRMVRRGSVSSVGSGSVMGTGGRGGAATRPVLSRQNSSGSMTGRTFRGQSPGRYSTNGALSPTPNAPAVPSLPVSIPNGHYRSSSLEPPMRVSSPVHQNGRAMSMDRTSKPPPPSNRNSKRLSNVTEEIERMGLERADSNRNRNFSRPISSPTSSSPPLSPVAAATGHTHGTRGWNTEPVGTLPAADSRSAALEQKIARIQAATGQPTQKQGNATSAQGSHLARATRPLSINTTSEAQSRSQEPEQEVTMVYDPNSRQFVPRLREKAKVVEPPSPLLPQPQALPPGAYDPSTRSIVPAPAPVAAATAAKPAMRSSQVTPSTASTDQAGGQESLSPANTDLAPPPKNPARFSPNDSPSRFLQKRPSVVREDPEAEEKAALSSPASTSTPNGRLSPTPAKSYAPAGASHMRASSLDIPQRGTNGSMRGRGASASPSPGRSARFSASPVVEATRHNPPPRDISPAKSAMKHSPAPSLRTSSPLAHLSSMGPPSEMSDTASQTSQDGLPVMKRKSVRVSFEEKPLEIAPENAVASPRALSFQHAQSDDENDDEIMKPRPALPSFGSVRRSRVAPDVAEKVTEMPPARSGVSSDHAIGGILANANENPIVAHDDAVAPTAISPNLTGRASEDSDLDINVPQQSAGPATTSAPTTSATTTSATTTSAPTTSAPTTSAPLTSASSLNKDEIAATERNHVPGIALQPPTPGEEVRALEVEQITSARPNSLEGMAVPGGWTRDEEDASKVAASGTSVETEKNFDSQPIFTSSDLEEMPALQAMVDESDDNADFSDAPQDHSEVDNGPFLSLDAVAVTPVTQPAPTSSTSPSGSPADQQAAGRIYPGSAVSAPASGDWSDATAYWSNLSKQQRDQIERDHMSSDDEATPTPSGNKAKKKTPLNTQQVSSASRAEPEGLASRSPQAAQPVKSAMKKSMRKQPDPLPVADNEVHMRRSLRTDSGGVMTTMRDKPPQPRPQAEPRSALQKGSMRPASASQLTSPTSPAFASSPVANPQDSAYPRLQNKKTPQPTPIMTAKLSKELANDSDSESSFRKKRRPASTVDSAGRYSMKRSMRAGSVDRHPPPRDQRPTSPTTARGKDSFSVRSLSPTGSFFGRNRGERLRESLRSGSVDAAATRMTLRNGPPVKSNTQSKLGGASSRPASAQVSRPPRFKSRFANDSDDEEDGKPSRDLFRSRYDDSDDSDGGEFIAADLTPVRGIPRRTGRDDGDSTDLEEESGAEQADRRKASRMREKQAKPNVPSSADVDKAMEIARQRLGNKAPTQATNEGSALNRGSLRNGSADVKTDLHSRPQEAQEVVPEKKKRGLIGTILRRNRDSTTSVPGYTPSSPMSSAPPSPAIARQPATPDKPKETAAGATSTTASPAAPATESPALKNTSPQNKLVRRSSAQQAPTRVKRGDSTYSIYSNATAPPDMSSGRVDTADWPFPPPVPTIPTAFDTARPQTSEGRPSVRFEDGEDESTMASPSSAKTHQEVFSKRTGKKKKFGMLRRAFRLND